MRSAHILFKTIFMKKPIYLTKHARDAIHGIKNAIDQQPFGKKNIIELALDAGIGRNLLQKGFKHLFGSRVNEYQKQKRMEAAILILDQGHFTIQQVASMCGYRSQSSFTRAFKDIYSITPSEWQNRDPFPPSSTISL
jgi:AraC family transcriptional regulator